MIFGTNFPSGGINSGAKIVGGCQGTFPHAETEKTLTYTINFISDTKDYDFIIVTVYPNPAIAKIHSGETGYGIDNTTPIQNILIGTTGQIIGLMRFSNNSSTMYDRLLMFDFEIDKDLGTLELSRQNSITADGSTFFSCVAYKY